MKTLILLILVYTNTTCFTPKATEVIFKKKSETDIASYLISKGYYLSSKGDRIIQFDHNKKCFPSLSIFFKDINLKEPNLIELNLTSENANDYKIFEESLKSDFKVIKTVFSKEHNNYIIKSSNNIIDIYYKSFKNIYGRKVIRCYICPFGKGLPIVNDFE